MVLLRFSSHGSSLPPSAPAVLENEDGRPSLLQPEKARISTRLPMHLGPPRRATNQRAISTSHGAGALRTSPLSHAELDAATVTCSKKAQPDILTPIALFHRPMLAPFVDACLALLQVQKLALPRPSKMSGSLTSSPASCGPAAAFSLTAAPTAIISTPYAYRSQCPANLELSVDRIFDSDAPEHASEYFSGTPSRLRH